MNISISSGLPHLLSATVLILIATGSLAQTPVGNLSEALNKFLYFYDAEKSGASRSMGQQPLAWRGDSEPTDAVVPLIYNVEYGTNLPEAFIDQYRNILDPDGDVDRRIRPHLLSKVPRYHLCAL